MPKNSKNGVHGVKYTHIKNWVDFTLDENKKFTRKQNRKIERYYREIRRLTGRPTMIWEPHFRQKKGESNRAYEARQISTLQKVQEYSQHNMRWPEIRVAFIPLPYENAKVKVSPSGEVRIEAKNFSVRELDFSIDTPQKMKLFLEDEAKYIQSKIPKGSKKFYSVKFGKSEIGDPVKSNLVGTYAARRLHFYAQKGAVEHGIVDQRIFKKNMKRLAGLIIGVSEYSFKNQKSAGAYAAAKAKYKKSHKKIQPVKKYLRKLHRSKNAK